MTDPQVPGKAIPALPKIKRQSNKGGLQDVDSKSRDAQEVTSTIERSSLDRTYNSPWIPKAIQMVVNKELESQYREKKTAMKEEGRPARELQDHFAFILVKDPSIMKKIAREGVMAKRIAFNALGDSKLGIYVCKHADVQLKLAESWKVNRCHLIVCKVMYGKCKPVTAHNQTGSQMEPTPNFDCHISQEKANPNDPFSLQIMKSMVYMYEYNEDYETIDRPKHCVPYAFVVYEKSNERRTSSDTKAPQWTTKTKSQTISRPTSGGNEAVRKSNREAFEKRVAGFYPAPQFPHLYIPPMENRMIGKKGLLPIPVSSPVYSVYQTRQDPRMRTGSQESEDSARMRPEEEQHIAPYSPGGNHVDNGEEHIPTAEEHIPTPERELEESIIKASFRKDAQSGEPSETSDEKEEVDLSTLNVNSDQLEAVVKHLEAVLRRKQEELLMRERMVHTDHDHEPPPENEQVPQIQDVDERISHRPPNAKGSYIVNEMGDIDERVRSSSLVQNNSWNINFSSAFGFDPSSIPFPKSKVELPINEEKDTHNADIIQEVPMDIDSDSESNPIKSTLQTNTNDLSPKGKKSGRKVSLSDYKARRQQGSPIRSKVNEMKTSNENTSNINDRNKGLLPLPPHVVTSSYSQYLTEEQAMSFQQSYPRDRTRSVEHVHLRPPDVSTSQQISHTIHNPPSSGYSPRGSSNQIASLKSPNASLSPASAGSTHFGFFQRSPTGHSPGASSNQPIGNILQKVNVDISNIKSILQSIAASPTSTPASSPEKNIWSSAHEDVPWIQLKEVKRQLSYEEEQAELRYDAYNLKTSKTEIPLEDDDDTDYTSLISKIKNLQHEIDQIKKDKKSRNAEWPSPLKDAKEIVDKKLESNKNEISSVSRGADLLQDLQNFEEKREQNEEAEKTSEVHDLSVSGVDIPGLGFSDESPEKTISASNERLKPDVEIIDVSDDDVIVKESKRLEDAELVELSDNPDSDDNCLVICDHPPEENRESSRPGGDSFNKDSPRIDDKTAKYSESRSLPIKEHRFQVPLDTSSPIKQHSRNSVMDRNADTEKDIGYTSCEDSYSSGMDCSPIKRKIYSSIPSNKDSEDESRGALSDMLNIKPEENSAEIQIKETATKLSATNPADITENTNSTDTAISDDTKMKAQRAKMKAYILKKNRGMIGYTKKRKRKKKTTDTDDFVSTTSSDLLDISESLSVDRFSGAMSSNTRLSSPMEFIPKLNTLLNDLGVKHWTDGLNVKELQPVVYLRRCDDPKSATDQPLTRKRLESQTSENLPDVDSRFPQHKDDRVKEWIEGTRKKIKLTLKDQQNNEQVNAKSIPVLETAEKNVSTPITVKPEEEKICVPKSNEINEIKTEQPDCLSQIKQEPSSTSDTSMANKAVKQEQNVTQRQPRNASPITVISSKPSVVPQTRVLTPVVISTQPQSHFKPLNVPSSSQLASPREDVAISQIGKISASTPLLPLPFTTIKSEAVIQQSTANLMSETSTSPSQPPPHQNANQLTRSYHSNLTSLTGSPWPQRIVNPISAVQQRLPVPSPSAGIHLSLPSFRVPYLPSAGNITLTPTAVSHGQPLVLNTQPIVKSVPSVVNTPVSTILVVPQNVQVRAVERTSLRNLVPVSTTYGTNLNFPPSYTYTSASQHPFPVQRFQSPITQPVYQGLYHPTQQSSTQNLQLNNQRPPYSNQPLLQNLHPGTFQQSHQVIPQPEQGMSGHHILQGVQPPPPQVIPPQPVHQNLQPYTNLPNNQVPNASTSANFGTTNDNAPIKKKSTDVMDWFAEKFEPKKHVKESGTSSYHDTYPDSDSRRSWRSRSRSPTDSYHESLQSPNSRKKRSDSFLAYGCQLQEAGRNEIDIKTKDAHDLSPRKSKTLDEERRDSPDERKQPLETQTSTNTQRLTNGCIMNLRERMQDNTKEIECSGSIFEETFGNGNPKPAFRNTFKLVTNDVYQPEREIADTPASPDNDDPNISFETPASPEQETPASPDHNVSEIPQIACEIIIDVSESPDRPTDDEKVDLLDSSIDGLARKREFLRRQLDDLRSSSGSPRVSRNVELKTNDFIEISDEELEEGEIADEGSDVQGKGRRVVAVRETDDTKDKIIGKYQKGLSVTVKSKGNLNHVDKKEVTNTHRDSGKDMERKSKRERSWSSDDSDHKTDTKSSGSKRDKYSRDHESRRYKSRGRSPSTEKHRERHRSSSTNRHYRSRDRSLNNDRRYKSSNCSSSSNRRYRSPDRSSSSDRKYRSHGRSSSSDRQFRSRGGSSSSDRRYKLRGRSSSKDIRQDQYKKSRRHVYKVYDGDSSEDSLKTKNYGGKSRGYLQVSKSEGNGESHKEEEKSAETKRIPLERKYNTSTAANAWTEMLRQKPTNIEVIKGDREITAISKSNEDDLNVYKELKEYITLKNTQVSSTNFNGNRQVDMSEESKAAAKGFVQVIRNTTSVETLKSWAIKEFKFKSESEFDKIAPQITVNVDREIAKLSKHQRKSSKSKLRKEIEVAMETLRIENRNARQSSTVAESVVSDDKSVLEIRPFEPLNFTKLLIEKELEIVRDHLKRLWHSTQELIDGTPRIQQSGVSTMNNGVHLFSIRQDMQQIETDLVQRISTYGAHFGVPNRRVPNELLTAEEKNGHFSEESLVLVLSGYIPSKAFQKLSSLREKLENSKKEIANAESVQNKEQLQRLKMGKEEIHKARKAMMLSFTGPLSKKRIQKIKTKAKCYRNCIDYFKKELGEYDADSRLRYLMISLQDLDKHYNLLTQLQDEQEKQKHEEITQDIHLKRRRVMVDKFHENFRFVDNQLNSMYAKYQHTHPHVCVAITEVSKKIKEALTLINAEKDSKNISVTTVSELEKILKSCLSGYEHVKQQIGRLV